MSTQVHSVPPATLTSPPRFASTAWRRFAEGIEVGDVVTGRVVYVCSRYVLVEVLAGATGLVPRHEVDYVDRSDPTTLFRAGDVVAVLVLAMDVARGRATLSIKAGYGRTPIELEAAGSIPSLPRPHTSTPNSRTSSRGRRVGVPGARGPGMDELRRQLAESRRELRKARRQANHCGPEHGVAADALTSDRAFLREVRVAYARTVDEADRPEFPLRQMKIGRRFLAQVREIQGIAVEKIVAVCADIACGRVSRLAGRSAHLARARGTPPRLRKSDGAKLWRASLQSGTPGARRIQWWDVSGDEGGHVEFASVAHHDDFSAAE